jgi:tripartite ATP-independent transporter DctM subunit
VSGIEIGLLLVAALIALLVARVPIAVAMLAVGLAGYVALSGWGPLLAHLKTAAYYRFATYELTVVPLFLLMGAFAGAAGVNRALFDACNVWLGHRRGGLAMAGIGACGAFSAVCGSSLATASTMGQVALPEMRRHGYAGSLATGSLAAGGTLGILIPPSVVLVLYAVIAEQNIVEMFVAALLPGLLAVAGYVAAVWVSVRLDPAAGPAGAKASWHARLRALAGVWQVAAIFLVVIGGIYAGWFTPTEGAAIGAALTGLLAWATGGLRGGGLADCLLMTARTTAMIFLILLGAELFNSALALARLPTAVAELAAGSGLSPWLVLAGMLGLYLLLGCVMDSLSMILLTVPIFLPVVIGLDLGLAPGEVAVWFGILALIVVEVGLITPPVGLNVFVINAMARDVPMTETFRGVLPFVLADLVRVVLLVAFPGITLGLVRWWM